MLPDFTPYGYQIVDKIQQNVQGGRITYKAIEINTQKPVIIKQFSFATKTWDGYKEIEREIKVLQGLNHDGIPKFLDKFDTDNGLCLAQEYKDAPPLSEYRSFSAEEIKTIAVQLLEILVYLQKRIPPIIHRDIKPENVLVSSQSSQIANGIKVYLIDFGLARIGNNTMALSSMIGGTFGFMPPEQIHNQKLTEASDLYGLGATLICLITQTKSANIGELVDFSTNKINFKDQVPKYSVKFIQWLEKMVKPNPNQRFQNAEEALKALKPVYVIRVPDVNLNLSRLNIEANKVNEKISNIIIITNKIPDTILQGKWSVSPHPKDPPHTPDRHSWISFSPQQFEGNLVKCVVTINTSKLKADRKYEREIVLISNAKQENYCIKVNLKTAPIRFTSVPMPPYKLLAVSSLVLAISVVILIHSRFWIANIDLVKIYELFFFGRVIMGLIVGIICGTIVGVVSAIYQYQSMSIIFTFKNNILRFINNVISKVLVWMGIGASYGVLIGVIFGILWGAVLTVFMIYQKAVEEIDYIYLDQKPLIHEEILEKMEMNFYNRGFKDKDINFYVLTTMAVGIFLGVGLALGFNFIVIGGLLISSLVWAKGLIYPPLKLWKLKAEYRRQESKNLIES